MFLLRTAITLWKLDGYSQDLYTMCLAQKQSLSMLPYIKERSGDYEEFLCSKPEAEMKAPTKFVLRQDGLKIAKAVFGTCR